MKSGVSKPKTIDEYISISPEAVKNILQKIRETIHKAAPKATEEIKNNMPSFNYNGNVARFCFGKNNIEFYPSQSAAENFRSELAEYGIIKDAVQFSLTKSVPYKLIAKIVKFRVRELIEQQKQNK